MTLSPDDFRLAVVSNLASLPETLGDLIGQDIEFRTEMQLPSDGSIRVGQAPPVQGSVLFGGVREAVTTGESVVVQGLDGGGVVIEAGGGEKVKIRQSGPDVEAQVGHSVELLLLHPERDRRLAALQEVARAHGPTFPDHGLWVNRAESGPLSDEGVWQFFELIGQTLPSVRRRLAQSVASVARGETLPESPDFLVPSEPAYYENLCGVATPGLERDEYLSVLLRPRLEAAVAEDLASGLDLLLSMPLYWHLRASDVLGGAGDDEVKAVLEAAGPRYDPVSRINLLDISLARAGRESYFASLAKQLLGELPTGEAIVEGASWDANVLFSALVPYCAARIRLIGALADRPVYWRRLCAWVHSVQLVRLLSAWQINQDFWLPWLHRARADLHPMATLLELMEAPFSREHLQEPLDAGSYLRGQMLLALTFHEEEALELLGGAEARSQCLSGDATEGLNRFAMARFGPLDLSGPTPTPLTEGAGDLDFGDEDDSPLRVLEAEPRDSRVWGVLDLAAEIQPLSLRVIEGIESSLQKLETTRLSDGAVRQVLDGYLSIASLACKLGHEQIAKSALAIAKSLLRAGISGSDFEQVVLAALVCCCGFRERQRVFDEYSDFLLEAAYHADSTGVPFLVEALEEMRGVLGVEDWRFGQAESVCRAAG